MLKYNLLFLVFFYVYGGVYGNTTPCNLPLNINGQKLPSSSYNCSRSKPEVVETPSSATSFRDAFGRPIGVPTFPGHNHMTRSSFPQNNAGGVCLTDSDITEQLVEIINNVLVNVRFHDDGVPIYLQNGQLVMNPKYRELMMRRKNAKKRENYFCPKDYVGRPCEINFRYGSEISECDDDFQCKSDDGYLRLCCKDYCLDKNVCKPALAKILN